MAAAPRSPWVGFSAVSVGTLMATIDGSIVNVALPALRADLGATLGGAEWVVTTYLLVISATLLAAGRVGDVAGHRRVFVGGLVLFTAASGLCGLAPGLGALVAARALQALGAAAMMAIAPAVVTAVFPADRRGRALGAVTSVVAVGLTAGPPLGGLLVQHLSWRWVFLVNLPVGVAGALWAWRALPETAGARGAAGPSGAAAALRRPEVAAGALAGFLSYAALFTASLLNPFYLAEVRGLSPRALGGMLTVVPVALSVASPVGGWLADRLPSRAQPLAAMALLALGLAGLAQGGAGLPLAGFAARAFLLGLGMGLFQPPNNSAVMGALPREHLGAGGGLLATARNAGMASGIALAGALFQARAGPAPGPDAFLEGYRAALLAGAGLAVAAGLASLAVRPSGAPRRR
jgi:MFS family permease